MSSRWVLVLAAGVLALAGCGAEQAASQGASGVTGVVRLGPQCPVQRVDRPCKDKPAAHVTVTVFEEVPGVTPAAGRVVARGTTESTGRYRVAVVPGDYVVTADAGMFCRLTVVHVTEDAYVRADISCDTGIR